MGAKTALMVFADRDPREVLRPGLCAEPEASRVLVDQIFPGRITDTLDAWNLADAVYPPDGTVYAGRFAGLDIVCCRNFMDLAPEAVEELVLPLGRDRRAYLHLMHSVGDALTFACWAEGRLVRSLSLSPDAGVTRDHGARLEFEKPYWVGAHPVHPDPAWWDDTDDAPAYPLPFHPLELGEQALKHFFGFILEGRRDASCINPAEVHLAGFRLTPTQEDLDRAAAIAEAARRMTRRTITLPPAPPTPR